ncbi:type 1 periplasmic binding fold superfamily protein [Flavivirga sp. 57AJ16]|uniref:type 1 periplasmic binding fold superfamily protein n=1 Tax=Flavivirga sp. 57AJ16 TaxID=3025307 RepID=UPI0023671A2F|nr:type 1 periplasmic binding fold superfamily protein [Flavivirga sp. 57AJ16]MDD7887390.1 type 1 periplasmic binding fold superfamily protein [Flavivirga sp. 57AJ16]
MKILKKISILLISTLVFNACSNDDDNPAPVNEEEVITTLTATLTPNGGGTAITLQTRDLDGDGPNAPVITVSGPLATNTTYNVNLELLNETESPAESINEEIEEEDDEHQFFYQITNNLATFSYLDFDGDSNPLGLEFTVTTTNTTGTGNLTITLRHEPNKNASGVSDGDITNAGGETDIQAVFSITVE